MKMRRIRVRSLLAGCISCLRCVWTSGLTCRSSPFASPRTAVLSSRLSFALQLARFFFLFFLFFNYYCYNYCIPQQPSSRKRKISFTESSLYIASFHIGASPLGLQWTHLFIAATDCGEHWPKDAQTLSYTRL